MFQVDITNKEAIFNLLKNLRPDTTPTFGIMTAQHTMEHLAFTVQFSNGKKPQELYTSPERAEKIKSIIIYTDKKIPEGVSLPVLQTEDLLPLEFPNLKVAIENLILELVDFDNYFQLNPNEKPVHPTIGALTYAEWIVFHNKHFAHHLKQFRLI